jgi:hypothetical protein
MPDRRTHRGPHPEDAELFNSGTIGGLVAALEDYSLLLTKGYTEKSALKLVGDHFSLTQRQRLALMRSACSDRQLVSRRQRCVAVEDLAAKVVAIDGYNLLITIEAAISGAIIFEGRDGCFRDLASIHGTYRKVTETVPALEMIGEFLAKIGISQSCWFLDSPVSNSGRLKKLMGELAGRNRWDWDVQLLTSPDAHLIKTDSIVASSDSVILDCCARWTNLARTMIERSLPNTHLLDLSPCSSVKSFQAMPH